MLLVKLIHSFHCTLQEDWKRTSEEIETMFIYIIMIL